MAAKSTKKRKTTGRRTKKQENTALKEEILILAVLAVCILLVISNFGLGGIAGEAVSSVMFGLFGFMAYLLPFILFGVVAFSISNKGNAHAYIKVGAIVLLLLLLTAFLELVMNPYDSEAGLLTYYKLASQHKNAGGLIGGCIVKLLCPLIGVVGTYVVIIIFAVICVILITEKSLLAPLGHHSKKAYEDARTKKAAAARRRVEQKQQRETEKQKRQDRKVSGVSFATTLSDKTIHRKTPDLQELTPEDTGDVYKRQLRDFNSFSIARI